MRPPYYRRVRHRTIRAATVAFMSSPERAWPNIHRHPLDLLMFDPPPTSASNAELILDVKHPCPHCRIFILVSAPTPAVRHAMRALEVDVYDAYLENQRRCPWS
jgi:hypothetical protein